MKYEAPSNEAELLDSLRQSEESLGRMISDFNNDSLRHLMRMQKISDEDFSSFQESLSPHDLTLVMKQYELEMKNPLKNAFIGEFVRMVLIQIQKQKTDVERLMLQMDKIMKANELNFQLFALFPVVAFIYGAYYFVTKERQNLVAMKRIQVLFQETHILLNSNLTHHVQTSGAFVTEEKRHQLAPTDYGRLIISLSRMRHASTLLILSDAREWFQRDLQEIETETYTIHQRLNTMDRMYRTYKFLSVG